MYYQGEWLFYWRIQDAQSQKADLFFYGIDRTPSKAVHIHA